jgi:hypothetical protein
MTNIRIKPALERIESELSRVRTQISYSGINAKDARSIDNLATNLAVEAAEIAGEARQAMERHHPQYSGSPMASVAQKLVAKVRKALGFTYP